MHARHERLKAKTRCSHQLYHMDMAMLHTPPLSRSVVVHCGRTPDVKWRAARKGCTTWRSAAYPCGCAHLHAHGHLSYGRCSLYDVPQHTCSSPLHRSLLADEGMLVQIHGHCPLIALSHAAQVSAASEESPERSPVLAIDGDEETRWGSIFTDGQWIQVDLDQRYAISSVEVLWEDALPVDYTVQLCTAETADSCERLSVVQPVNNEDERRRAKQRALAGDDEVEEDEGDGENQDEGEKDTEEEADEGESPHEVDVVHAARSEAQPAVADGNQQLTSIDGVDEQAGMLAAPSKATDANAEDVSTRTAGVATALSVESPAETSDSYQPGDDESYEVGGEDGDGAPATDTVAQDAAQGDDNAVAQDSTPCTPCTDRPDGYMQARMRVE